jgi:asparaginyl-tRNA synthetase
MASLGVRHYVARLPQRLQRCYSTSAAEVITVDRLLRASSPKEGNVTVNGYIRSIRNQKTRSFAAVGDGTTLQPIQALLTPAQAQEYVTRHEWSCPSPTDQSTSLTTGSAVSLTGSWKPSPKSDIQRHELHVEDVTLVGAADPAVCSNSLLRKT